MGLQSEDLQELLEAGFWPKTCFIVFDDIKILFLSLTT